MSSIDAFYPLLPPPHPPRVRPGRSPRANLNRIYSKPLPIEIFPLPPLIPHNPLSLLYVAYAYCSAYFSTPTFHHRNKIKGYYSPSTRSVHVTDPQAVRYLWESGFFGKGALSRSEPTWLDRELKRRGLKNTEASENFTAARREERRKFKTERARQAQEAIDEQLMEELLVDKIASAHKHDPGGCAGKPTLRSKYEGIAEAALLSPSKQIFFGQANPVQQLPSSPTRNQDPTKQEHNTVPASTTDLTLGLSTTPPITSDTSMIPNQEHLQLTPEESFFLSYALGILSVQPPLPPSANSDSAKDASSLTTPFTTCTLFKTLLMHNSIPASASLALSDHDPSNPFLLTYATYHHFRSLGWVVRPGLKFGVDWLLYLRGPVFSHAEFAVVVLPAYTNAYWHTSHSPPESGSDADAHRNMRAQKSWHWLHCQQRVQAHVRKSLVVAWVEIPPPLSNLNLPNSPIPEKGSSSANSDLSSKTKAEEDGEEGQEVDIGRILHRYKVREMVVKRWIPNRSRD